MHNCHPNTAQVLSALDRGERRLFHDRVRHLDRRILPGVSKLSWAAPKPALDFFFHEAAKCDMHSDHCPGRLLHERGYMHVELYLYMQCSIAGACSHTSSVS